MMQASYVGWAALTGAILANVAANLLLKHAMSARALGQEAAGSPLQNLPVLLGGLLAAGSLLVLYLIALRHLPVSVAYPIVTGLAMVGIALCSAPLFGEALNLTKILGIAGVVLSTVLILRS
jgi:small multidrug resistance pump